MGLHLFFCVGNKLIDTAPCYLERTPPKSITVSIASLPIEATLSIFAFAGEVFERWELPGDVQCYNFPS